MSSVPHRSVWRVVPRPTPCPAHGVRRARVTEAARRHTLLSPSPLRSPLVVPRHGGGRFPDGDQATGADGRWRPPPRQRPPAPDAFVGVAVAVAVAGAWGRVERRSAARRSERGTAPLESAGVWPAGARGRPHGARGAGPSRAGGVVCVGAPRRRLRWPGAPLGAGSALRTARGSRARYSGGSRAALPPVRCTAILLARVLREPYSRVPLSQTQWLCAAASGHCAPRPPSPAWPRSSGLNDRFAMRQSL